MTTGGVSTPRRGGLAMAALVLSAAYFAIGVLWRRSAGSSGLVAYDFYGQFYPHAVHAWRSVRAGGGLLWNPYQDSGQPFLAIIHVGLLYPVNLLFALLAREPALVATTIVNLAIAGIGTFGLCRTIGVGTAAGCCAAAAFQLGWAATNLAAWSPSHIGTLAWLPVAMWQAERLVRAPGVRGAVLLALALAAQILAGFPEIVFYTSQLVGLRVVWALVWRESGRPAALLAAAGGGLALAVLLTAVQLVPSVELAVRSVRGGALGAGQFGGGAGWPLVRASVAAHLAIEGNALVVALALVGVVGARRIGRPRAAGFYLLVAVAYFVLSMGRGTPLFALYQLLPLARAFRGPGRLLWVTSFALAVLVGLGAQALLEAGAAGRSRWRAALVGTIVGATAVTGLTAARGLRPVDLVLVTALVLTALAAGRPPLRGLAACVLPVLVFADCGLAGRPPVFGLRRGDVYGEHAAAFAFVRARRSPQDRVLIVGDYPDLGLMPKSALLFAVPSIHDYEGMAVRRYAEFLTFMRTGRAMRDIDDWYWLFGRLLPAGMRRPLFDTTAARYLLVNPRLDETAAALGPGVRLLFDDGRVRVYENPQALPRARYVARVVVVADEEVLPVLAGGAVDPRATAVVSDAPRSGFTGSTGDATGSADILADDPERVVVRVRAAARGFLFLADLHFPGWRATVNGREAGIVRANHAFRLVEVPAGESEVVFTYRPWTVRAGVLVSLAAALLSAVLWRAAGPA